MDTIGLHTVTVSAGASERAMSVDSSRSVGCGIAGSAPEWNEQVSNNDPMESAFLFDSGEGGLKLEGSHADEVAGDLIEFSDLEYNEQEEIEEYQTLEDLQQRLEDAMGAELEEQVHEARACLKYKTNTMDSPSS